MSGNSYALQEFLQVIFDNYSLLIVISLVFSYYLYFPKDSFIE